MTLYSTSPLQPSLGGPNPDLQIYFRAFVRVVPDLAFSRRWEMIRHMEKIQHLAELSLEDIAALRIEGPIQFTHQIGNAPARLSIAGWLTSTGPNVPPVDRTTQPGEIHSGTIPGEKTALIEEIPRGGDLARGQDPTTATDSRAAAIKDAIETALVDISGIEEVFFLDVNGVKYGQIPNRKGFRSFPS